MYNIVVTQINFYRRYIFVLQCRAHFTKTELDLVNLESGPGEPVPGEPRIWNLDLVNLEPRPGEPGPRSRPKPGIWNLDLVNLEPEPY